MRFNALAARIWRKRAARISPELGTRIWPDQATSTAAQSSHLNGLQRIQHLANASPQVAELQRLQARARAFANWAKINKIIEESDKFNTAETRANTKAYAAKNPGKAGMVNSAGGAWLANQMNLKKEEDRTHIGPTEAYMGAKEDANSAYAKHLNKFAEGGHAFITDWAHRNIMDPKSNFKGWGMDANFVGTSSAAQKLVDEACKEGGFGLYYLEKSLGVPDGNWVSSCEGINYGIYRYHVKNPADLNIRMASGAESQAYSPWYEEATDTFHEGVWVPKGQTLGGADEAVVNALLRREFNAAEQKGDIVIELDESMRFNTLREKEENCRSWKKKE